MIRIAHLGAGNHASSKSRKYEQLLYRSLSKGSSLETCCAIEDSDLTNTGRGSNVNVLGKVQCDASFITVENRTVKSGSMFNIVHKRPVERLLEVSRILENWHSSVNKPYLMDYNNLHLLNIETHNEDTNGDLQLLLITPAIAQIYNEYKHQIDSQITAMNLSEVCDTIGVTNIDLNLRLCEIMCSSGGNFFKLPNRIGCAALIGSGIDFTFKDESTSISIMCTGNGEQICQLKLASYIANNIIIIPDIEEEDHTEEGTPSYAIQIQRLIQQLEQVYQIESYFGLVVCITEKTHSTIVYLHTTETFYWGFRFKEKIDIILSRSKNKGRITYGEFFLRHN